MPIDVERLRGVIREWRESPIDLFEEFNDTRLEAMLDEIEQLRAAALQPKYAVGQLVVSVEEKQVFEVEAVELTFVYRGVNRGAPDLGIRDRVFEVIEQHVEPFKE